MKHSGITRSWPLTPSLPAATVGIAVLAAPLFGWAIAYESWRLLVGLAIVAVLPAIARWPVVPTFGLYAMLATSLDAFPLLPGGATLTKPVGILAGGALLTAGLIERRLGRPPQAALWWGLLVLLGVLSAAWAIDATLVFQRLPTVLSLFILYLVAVCFRPSQQEIYWVCALTVLGGVVASALAYTFGLDELAVGTAARGRLMLGGMDTNPNTLGRILLLPLALAIAGFVGWRGLLPRLMALGCAGLIGMGIFISMSRGAVVAMAVMLSVLFYRMRVRRHIVVAIVLLLALAAVMPQAFYDRIGAVISGEDATGSGRLEIWRIGLRAVEDFGLVGAGLNHFPEVYKRYVPAQSGIGAHNIYLMLSVELGAIGLALLLAAIGSQLLAVREMRRTGLGGVALAATEAACFGMLTGTLFADTMWTKSFWLTWTLLTWCIYGEKRSHAASGGQPVRG